MQSVSSTFTGQSGGNSNLSYLTYGTSISWTKQINPIYQFFTIGVSSIGGPDFIPGSGSVPSFFNQYQYTDYSDYALSWSVTRNIGQYPYGAFGAEGDVILDNTSLLFLPGYDPIIGQYIVNGRPLNIAAGFSGETISLFYGLTTNPQNDVSNRQITLQAFDGMDYLNLFQSKAQGPLALANNGSYINVTFDQIIEDLLLEAGISLTQMVLETSTQLPIGYFSPYNLLIGDIIQAGCEAEQGLFFFDENGIARFWNRQHIANNQSSVWTFDETSSIQLEPKDTPVINHVIIQASPRSVQTKQPIWELSSAISIPLASSTITLANLCTNPSFEINTTNWSVSAGTLTRVTSDSWIGSACAQLVSTGTSQYMYNTIACSISTAYVAQCYIKGTAGVVVTVAAVESTVTIGSINMTLTGAWDLVSVPSFTSDGSNTSFDLRIYPNSSTTIKVDGAMVQPAVGASATYFDGNTVYNASYIYSWNGATNDSTSRGLPVGSVTIPADFQDTFGAIPVTSVDLPVSFSSGSTAATSVYQANFAEDGSGLDASASVFIAGTSLTTSPTSAATLSGSNYTITFLNTSNQIVYITKLLLYGTPAKVTEQISQEYKNDASIALYGTNPANNGQPIIIQNDLIQSSSTALSNATTLVNDYSAPYQRLTADVFAVPQLQIGDTVTVGNNDVIQQSHTPLGILSSITQAISQSYTPMGLLVSITQARPLPQYTEYTVVGTVNSSSSDTLLAQQLELEVKILAHYFTIGVSAIGSATDQLAPG